MQKEKNLSPGYTGPIVKLPSTSSLGLNNLHWILGTNLQGIIGTASITYNNLLVGHGDQLLKQAGYTFFLI
jgi:hypothetical protein